jgi:hypothetical protein
MSSGLLGGCSSIAGVALGMNFSCIGDPQVGQNFSFSIMPTIDAYPSDHAGNPPVAILSDTGDPPVHRD